MTISNVDLQNNLESLTLQTQTTKSKSDKDSQDALQALDTMILTLQALLLVLSGGKSVAPEVAEQSIPLIPSTKPADQTLLTGVNGGETLATGVDSKVRKVIPKVAKDETSSEGFQSLSKKLFNEEKR